MTGSGIQLRGRHAMALVRFDDLTLHAYLDGVEIGSRPTDDTGGIQISSIGVGDNNFNGATYFPLVTVVERVRAFTFPSGGFEQNQLLLGRANQPATPTGLTATPGNLTVSPGWNTAPYASGYNVKRSVANGGPYAVIGTTRNRAYSDTALLNGTTYHYAVSASNSAGESANSAPASATPAAPPVPAAPAGVAITGNHAQVSLKWNASTSATGYKVMRALTQGGSYAVIGYDIRKHGVFSGRWTSGAAGDAVAEARKPSAMFRSFEVGWATPASPLFRRRFFVAPTSTRSRSLVPGQA